MDQLCGHRTDRDLAKEMLTLWLDEPDLAGLREPGRVGESSAGRAEGLPRPVGRVGGRTRPASGTLLRACRPACLPQAAAREALVTVRRPRTRVRVVA